MMDTYQAVIGTYSVRGSKELYAIRIEDGKMSVTDTAPSHDVGYLAAHPTDPVVYATRENMIFRGRANGGVGAYSLDDEGRLRLLNEAACAGQMPCHISISADGRKAYVSSFRRTHVCRRDRRFRQDRRTGKDPSAAGTGRDRAVGTLQH